MKITELLTSAEQVEALESAIRSLPGGHDAVEAAIEVVISGRNTETV